MPLLARTFLSLAFVGNLSFRLVGFRTAAKLIEVGSVCLC